MNKKIFSGERVIISTNTSSEQSNRLFVILATALIGVICIGILGVTSLILFKSQLSDQDQALQAEPTEAVAQVPTSTSTPTPTRIPDTPTPPPTPTSTQVVQPTATITPPPSNVEPQPVSAGPNGQGPSNGDADIAPPPEGEPLSNAVPQSGGVLFLGNETLLVSLGIITLTFSLIFGLVSHLRRPVR